MRGLLNTIVVALVTPWFCVRAYVARLFDASGDAVVEVARAWARAVSWLTGLRLALHGAEQLARDRPYVFMANHQSAADIWAVYATLPVRVRMIAKKQLRAIPLFGWAMWAGRFIFIDRQNPAAARRSIAEAEARIRGGDSVLLFPEGTRSRTGELLPFKKGGFHLAINAGVPIVPVVIHGTRAIIPPKRLRIRPGAVAIEVCPPIDTAGLTEGDRDRLIEQVRGVIAARLTDPPAPG